MIRRRTLSQITDRAWIGATALTAVVCLIVVLAVSLTEYRASLTGYRNDFLDRATKATRRIEAELALGSAGAPDPVSRMLDKDLSFGQVLIDAPTAACIPNPSCSYSRSGAFHFVQRIDTRGTQHTVEIIADEPAFSSSVKLGNLFWIALVIAILSLSGAYLQRRLLRRHILKPISDLVDTSSKSEPLPLDVPQEIEELSLRLQESLEARDKVVFGQLASGVIHDLRTQIHSILSALSLVDEVANPSESRTKRLELLNTAVSRNLPRMLSIIETTLDGSREIKPSLEDRDITSTLNSAVELNADLAAKRNVKVQAASGSGLCFIPHDHTQMSRVFSNLVRNAIEALENDETSSERTVQISTRDLGSEIEVAIEDNGPGLRMAQKDLFRLSRTTKPNGAGLGLLICKRIVDAHRGSITAGASNDLNGAKFSVRIPREATT